MPVVPSSVIEPFWDQFSELPPAHEAPQPLGCYRPRIADRIVFDTLVQVLVFGCTSHRIADEAVSATTLRRRRDAWSAAGIMDALLGRALAAYVRMIGPTLANLTIDCCITMALCWNPRWMRSVSPTRGCRSVSTAATILA